MILHFPDVMFQPSTHPFPLRIQGFEIVTNDELSGQETQFIGSLYAGTKFYYIFKKLFTVQK
jgi:hypothetical protein